MEASYVSHFYHPRKLEQTSEGCLRLEQPNDAVPSPMPQLATHATTAVLIAANMSKMSHTFTVRLGSTTDSDSTRQAEHDSANCSKDFYK